MCQPLNLCRRSLRQESAHNLVGNSTLAMPAPDFCDAIDNIHVPNCLDRTLSDSNASADARLDGQFDLGGICMPNAITTTQELKSWPSVDEPIYQFRGTQHNATIDA